MRRLSPAFNNGSLTSNSTTFQFGAAHAFWANGRTGIGATANMAHTPNSKFPDCASFTIGNIGPAGSGLFGSRSYHPGGVNTLFGDGSVHLVRTGVDPNLVIALAGRNDGLGVGNY